MRMSGGGFKGPRRQLGYAAIAGAVAAVGGAVIGSQGAKSAARTQARAAEAATAEQRRQFDLTREDLRPYREAGTLSLADLLRGTGLREGGTGYEGGDLTRRFSVADFWADPVTSLGYQSGLDEGRLGLERLSPLTTGRDSGAALKELTRFGTDYTGRKAAESQGRFTSDQSNIFNRLAALAGLGQSSTTQGAALGQNAANNISGIMTGAGDVGAASRIAQANAWSGGLQNIANWWQNQQRNRQQQRMWNDMMSTYRGTPQTGYVDQGAY